MGNPTCVCSNCGDTVLPTDTQCMACGASLLDEQKARWRQSQQESEALATQRRFEARLAKAGPRSAGCMVCGAAPGQATCKLCSRLICRGCVAAWEPDFLCPACRAVTALEAATEADLVRVTRELQRLDPSLARHSPRRLSAKVHGILARGRSACVSLGTAGAFEAQQALAQALSPVASQWRGPAPDPVADVPYTRPLIPMTAPTPEQVKTCQSVLASLNATSYGGSEVEPYVLETAQAAGVPPPALWLSPEPVPNACAVGFTGTHAHVVVTEGLLECCPPDEVRAIIGHEVAHIARADSVRNTALAARMLGIVLTGEAAAGLVEFGFLSDGDPGNDGVGLAIAGAIRVMATVAAATRLSRDLQRAEFAADALGGNLSGAHMQLASALTRLEQSQDPRRWVQAKAAQTSHMFLAPTGFQCAVSGVQTHPPTATRCQALCLIAGASSGWSADLDA